MTQMTREQFNKWTSEKFNGVDLKQKKQINLFDVNLILAFHKELGSEGFKSMISDSYIVSSQEGCDLIEKLINI